MSVLRFCKWNYAAFPQQKQPKLDEISLKSSKAQPTFLNGV
jgi:hypothetical protein